jgi:hypothetical protein
MSEQDHEPIHLRITDQIRRISEDKPIDTEYPNMKRTLLFSLIPLCLSGMSISMMAVPQSASAGGAYGPDTCRQGYVWREANADDHVCVRPSVRSQTARDNQQARYRIEPYGGAYGPNTCRQGYVWREAFSGDVVCVTPETRSQAAHDNQQAPYRYQP